MSQFSWYSKVDRLLFLIVTAFLGILSIFPILLVQFYGQPETWSKLEGNQQFILSWGLLFFALMQAVILWLFFRNCFTIYSWRKNVNNGATE